MTFYLKSHLFYIICHVASDTSQVASSQPTRQCTCATNDHRLHPCYVPSQSQARRPSAYGLSTRSHFASETSKPCLPAFYFTQNPNPTFPPNIFTLRPQSPLLYDSVECNGVGDEWPCAILRNPKWHETACSRRQAPISSSYPRKPNPAPPPLNRTSRQFHLCATWPRTQINRYLNLSGLPARRLRVEVTIIKTRESVKSFGFKNFYTGNLC